MLSNIYPVVYTRDTDCSLASSKQKDMKERLKIINSKHNILYLSIHANTYPSPLIHGAQTFYKALDEDSIRLANHIQDRLLKYDNTNKRSAKSIKDKYLIDNQLIPGVIVELGFLTNPGDAQTLQDSFELTKMMNQIYIGVLEYLNS